MILAAWLLSLPCRLLAALGLRRSMILACQSARLMAYHTKRHERMVGREVAAVLGPDAISSWADEGATPGLDLLADGSRCDRPLGDGGCGHTLVVHSCWSVSPSRQ
jgi:hypothetical protein